MISGSLQASKTQFTQQLRKEKLETLARKRRANILQEKADQDKKARQDAMNYLVQGPEAESLLKSQREKFIKCYENNNLKGLLQVVQFLRRRLAHACDENLFFPEFRQFEFLRAFIELAKQLKKRNLENDILMKETLWALSNYCAGMAYDLKFLVEEDFFTILLEVLKDTDSPDVLEVCFFCVSNICGGDLALRDELISKGLLEVVTGLIMQKKATLDSPDLKYRFCWMITSILYSPRTFEVVDSHQALLEYLWTCFETSDDIEVLKQTLTGLLEALCDCEKLVLALLSSTSKIERLYQKLYHPNLEIKMQTLKIFLALSTCENDEACVVLTTKELLEALAKAMESKKIPIKVVAVSIISNLFICPNTISEIIVAHPVFAKIKELLVTTKESVNLRNELSICVANLCLNIHPTVLLKILRDEFIGALVAFIENTVDSRKAHYTALRALNFLAYQGAHMQAEYVCNPVVNELKTQQYVLELALQASRKRHAQSEDIESEISQIEQLLNQALPGEEL